MIAPYLSVFGPNTGKYGPEKTPYLDGKLCKTFSYQKKIIFKIPSYMIFCFLHFNFQ